MVLIVLVLLVLEVQEKVTAEWMINDEINEDVFSLDISRFEKFHSDTNFIVERAAESLGNQYAMHWPYKQNKTSRNIKNFSIS